MAVFVITSGAITVYLAIHDPKLLERRMSHGYCRLVTISTDNITETNEYRRVSALTGPSSRTRGESSKKISTSPNIRMGVPACIRCVAG